VSAGAYPRLARELEREPRAWLVTGAAGFIGSHLVERLLALGQRVRGLDDFSAGTRANLARVAQRLPAAAWQRFELVEADVCALDAVRAACAGVDFVLHQAGVGSVPRSLLEPERALRVNAAGTWNVLAAARAVGVRRVVLASSSSVYGDAEETPQREERIGQALSPYAASKRVAELVAEGHARGLSLATVALRYFNVFGPRQDPHGPYAAVVPRWCARLLAGEPVRLEGDGRQTRDFTPVASVVEANLLAARAALPEAYVVLNVGTGRETSLLELHAELVARLRARGRLRAEPRLEAAPARSADRRASCAELTRARACLGYEPPATLAEGLEALLDELVDSRGGAS